MQIKPLICPQCGGEITNYTPGQVMVTCGYCGMRFVIEPDREKDDDPVPVYHEIDDSEPVSSNNLVSVVIVAFVVIVGIGLIGGLASLTAYKSSGPASIKPYSSTPASRTSPLPTPNPNLLEFGGKGTGDGLFKDANSIAVDKLGRIYVGDDSLRVQQFDDKGGFLWSWQMPKKTNYYDRAHTIGKIAVNDEGKLYAEVGGTIQVYNERSATAVRTIEVAPDFIGDLALKSDGGLLAVSSDDNIETLLFVNKVGRITKRIRGFLTDALDEPISPQSTAAAAARVAVDSAGNIFSIYALGDLGSYSISSNNDDLLIARFTPEGKFVSKSVQTMDSCGIEVDSKGRIYVSAQHDLIRIYTTSGDLVDTIVGLNGLRAFALDKDNNVYALLEDKVVKRPAVQ